MDEKKYYYLIFFYNKLDGSQQRYYLREHVTSGDVSGYLPINTDLVCPEYANRIVMITARDEREALEMCANFVSSLDNIRGICKLCASNQADVDVNFAGDVYAILRGVDGDNGNESGKEVNKE